MNPDSMESYFDGTALVGDDFTPSQVAQWFDEEREAYADLGAKDHSSYRYLYHALNRYHAFQHLDQNRTYRHACGFGSAYGEELLPIRDRIQRVTIVESSQKFKASLPDGVDVSYVPAQASGIINLPDRTFDLITCFGVLHHVANVSFVVSELVRCLELDGILIVREPTTSMGDWRYPRPGLTRRERGIPRAILRDILTSHGMRILHNSLCVFPPLVKLLGAMGIPTHAYLPTVVLDALLCRITAWNYSYHRRSISSRFAPSSDFYFCVR